MISLGSSTAWGYLFIGRLYHAQLVAQGVQTVLDELNAFFAGLLGAIDVASKQRSIDTDAMGHLRDIELWKASEDGSYLIVLYEFVWFKE